MKRGLFLLFCITIAFSACSEKKSENTMTVSGMIDGLKKGTLYFQKIGDSTLINIDSLEIKGDGNFEFSQELESPEVFYLYLKKADNNDLNDRIVFFGEQGEIHIKTYWNTFDSDAEITGSASHDKYLEFRGMISNFNKRDLELAQSSIQVDSLELDSLNKLRDANFVNKYRYVLNFGFNNLDSHVTPYAILSEAAEANPKYLDSISKSLTTEIAEGKYGKALSEYVEGLNEN